MNKKGFISISVIYSFFLVFIAIILAILTSYSNRRLLMNELKKDAKELLNSKTHFSCFSAGITKLNDCLIYTYGGEEVIKAQAQPDFSKATEEGESGLYSTEDNYGTSYYFRGDVKDNYVKFGQDYNGVDMYWRIVRINGNGTIRLIYDGTTLKPNNKTELDWDTEVINSAIHTINSELITTKYNTIGSGVADKKYVGYTYDDGTGKQADSNIKVVIDEWYKNNLLDYFSEYLADSYFCNDRSLSEDSEYYPYEHAAHDRLYKNPSLLCYNINDAYTVNDLNYGNALLKYPIAILSADEYLMAGAGLGKSNVTYYLSGPDGWTMTPSFSLTNKMNSSLWIMDSNGGLSAWYPEYGITAYFPDSNPKTIRPVINLNADVEIKKGDGTLDSPYIIELEGVD